MIRGKRKEFLAWNFLIKKMQEEGYDGLYNEEDWCWCSIKNLASCCGAILEDCELAKYYKIPILCPKCKSPLFEEDEMDDTMQRLDNEIHLLLPVYRPKLMCVYCHRYITGKPVR